MTNTMGNIINLTEVKKASDSDVIEAQIALAQEMSRREEMNISYDPDRLFAKVFAKDDIYLRPDSLNTVYPFGEMVVIPSIIPQRGSNGDYKTGKYVHAWVRIPGMEPYPAWSNDTPTIREAKTYNLKVVRGASIHSIVDGMIVVFHHVQRESAGTKTVTDVRGVMVYHDDNGDVQVTPVEDKSLLIFDLNYDSVDSAGYGDFL